MATPALSVSSKNLAAASLATAAPNSPPDLPPISALFLVEFDVKAGYTITWKRAAAGLKLEGVVEYKSLPSGLHEVADDLVYFVHEQGHAGLNAFINVPCDEAGARNARMLAVGVLVPLSYGRLGRAWRHAEKLKEMVGQVAKDRKAISILEDYWENNRAQQDLVSIESGETPLASPAVTQKIVQLQKGHQRNRSASDGLAILPKDHHLSPFHPAWSLSALLDTFGPLIFPIHRAALLRKRILLTCHAPVHEVCNYVYDISVLSNIPLATMTSLSPRQPIHRLRPLFAIGVHDIDFLQKDSKAINSAPRRPTGPISDATEQDEYGTGWVACTTDSILAQKTSLWDLLITMPPSHAAHAKEKTWPKIESAPGVNVQATQRDLRRYKVLRAALSRDDTETPLQQPPQRSTGATRRPGTSSTSQGELRGDDSLDLVVEPPSWASLAYNGFMWWASAGEQARGSEQEESARDAEMLSDLGLGVKKTRRMSSSTPAMGNSSAATRNDLESDRDAEARKELAIIAYFHRLTTQMLTVLSEAVDDNSYMDDDSEDENGAEGGSGPEHGVSLSTRHNDNQDSTFANRNSEDEGLLPSGNNRDDNNGDSSDDDAIQIGLRAMEEMGLDIWSARDADFVSHLMERYFGRRSYIESRGIELCGVRMC